MAAQAGAPLHFELYTKDDDVNYIKWKWISRKEAHRVLRGIDDDFRSRIHPQLRRPRPVQVDGREVPLTIDTVGEYFLLLEGNKVLRSARHFEDLSDWVPERSKTAKTWYANDVFIPVWRPIIQLVNVVLLGKQKPLEVTGAFLYILKNKVGHADEDEDLDWVTYFKEKLREKIRAYKKQMHATGKRKVRPMCIDIVVLHILKTCGIVDDEDIDLSSNIPECVQDLTSNSPEGRQDSPDPRDIPSSSSPGRHQDKADPTNIPSSSNPSSSPGRKKQASPTRAIRQHSPESSPRAPSTLSDHATRSGSSSNPDREDTTPSDNEPLVGFGSPMVPYPLDDDEAKEAVAVLTSLATSDPSPTSKGKRPVEHRSSSESEEIRFVRPDCVKRHVVDPVDEVGGPVSQQAESKGHGSLQPYLAGSRPPKLP
ncbi:hypothetical protein R1sor_003677 [Riccia sorocarpa]|uniref:Uncharacterized protein n=1 Tax=Riccia sorocarpa TaxID=122646 RepID=A0ABD3H5S1_9MARC